MDDDMDDDTYIWVWMIFLDVIRVDVYTGWMDDNDDGWVGVGAWNGIMKGDGVDSIWNELMNEWTTHLYQYLFNP